MDLSTISRVSYNLALSEIPSRWREWLILFFEFPGQVGNPDDISGTKQTMALFPDGVFPVPGHFPAKCIRTADDPLPVHTGHLLARSALRSVFFNHMIHQQTNILNTLSKGRQDQIKDIQPVIQIFPKTPLFGLTVSGLYWLPYNPDIDGNRRAREAGGDRPDRPQGRDPRRGDRPALRASRHPPWLQFHRLHHRPRQSALAGRRRGPEACFRPHAAVLDHCPRPPARRPVPIPARSASPSPAIAWPFRSPFASRVTPSMSPTISWVSTERACRKSS